VTYSNADSVHAQKLIQHFDEELRKRSQKLFCARVDANKVFYRTIFDDYPDCAEIIGTPEDGRQVAPTVYMIYREARFVLDSDASLSDQLDQDWAFLHVKVQDKLNPELSTRMARLNKAARWRVIACRDRLVDLMPRLEALLELRQYDEAESRFNEELVHIDQTFDAIIASYSPQALSSSS